MPPWNMALRLMARWCGVIVAAMLGPLASTKATASAVVMCSKTIFRAGKSATTWVRMRPMKTASRSKMSTWASVTSPWIRSGMPIRCMASSTG